MEDSFSRLEERIRGAVEEIHRLRGENASLTQRLEETQKRLASAERSRARAAEKKPDETEAREPEAQETARDLAALRQERAEIRNRLAKLVGLLDELG
jgi:predicted  nucleic acid-binding Zn-ribbon protein